MKPGTQLESPQLANPDRAPSRSSSLVDTLRRHTSARVALARTGDSLGTSEQLLFQLDHAAARDAVHAALDVPALVAALQPLGLNTIELSSAVPDDPSGSRATYLRRPDLGRVLAPESAARLRELASQSTSTPDLVFIVADGLSALAVQQHAAPLLAATLPLLASSSPAWTIGPVCIVRNGRVALGDHVGAILGARLAVVLLGERPGLSAADSLGAYITVNPAPGRTDAERNCISNIRTAGLPPAAAAARLVELLTAARNLGLSGVAQRAGALASLPAVTAP